MTATEAKLQQHLAACPDREGPEVAALLNDLALLRLEKGQTESALDLFQQALGARGGASGAARQEAQHEQSSAGDWEEGGWEAGLKELSPAQSPAQPSKRRSQRSNGVLRGQQGAGGKGAGKSAAKGEALLYKPPGLGSKSAKKGASAARGSAVEDAEEEAEVSPVIEVPFEGQHICEVVGVTSSTTDTQVEALLSSLDIPFPIKPAIRWADDTHAAVVFADVASARLALLEDAEGLLQLRAFAEASEAVRLISPRELQPPIVRPRTSTVVARRLLGNALNMNLRDKAAERQLRQHRVEKRFAAEVRARQLNAAWEEE